MRRGCYSAVVVERENKGLVLIAAPSAELRWQWSQGLGLRYAFHEVDEWHELDRGMTRHPAILLLDLALCPSGGTTEIPAIQRLSPLTKILALTGNPVQSEGIAALKAGAKGYCQRNVPPALMRKAVEMIQEGQVWMERTILPHLLEELTSPEEHRLQASALAPDASLTRLTHREREVADMIASGASNREIAHRLHITEATVKAHLTAIFRKLGVSDRLQLGLYVTRHTPVSGVDPKTVDQGLLRSKSN